MSGDDPGTDEAGTSWTFAIAGPRRRARLRLRGSFFVVGRGEPFPVFHDDPMLSREHLAVVAVPGGVRARDLGSRNGVLLNGERLGRYAEVSLRPGDVLVAGQTELRLLTEREAQGEDEAGAGDEHAVDEQGRTRALRLAAPPPFAPTDEPAPVDASSDDALVTASGDLPPEDDLPGDATSELDVPALPAPDAAPTGSVALPDQPTALEVPAADETDDEEDEPEVLEG
ncbi:MAG: FHA domain-containing protein [Planctomycetes bacterium]|nr:FHA domain-containing protein [Planctomycetota bacterium]